MTRDAARLFKREIQEASGSGCAIKRKENGPSGRCVGTRSNKVWPWGANREWASLSRHLQCRRAPPPPHRSFSLSAAQTNLLQTAKAARAMRSFLCAIVRQGFIQPLQQGCQRSLIAGGQTLA